MKVLHINTSDQGGAATAIIRIHLALLEKKIDSKILFLRKNSDIPAADDFHSWFKRNKRASLIKRVSVRIISKITALSKKKEAVRSKMSRVEVFTFPTSEYDITEHPAYKEADIVQLNWVSGFLDEASFFRKNKKPVIWRMADLYVCGGGNHYETGFPFTEFQTEIASNLAIRKKALESSKITLVAISHWVKQKAEQSDLLKRFGKYVIHNGIDGDKFKLLDKSACREIFSLAPEGKVILFGADRVNNARKGLNLCLEALDSLALPPNTRLCVFGTVKGKLRQNITNIGRIEDGRLLSALYSAADLFIMSSIEEAFGQVTIEALACGTPVVSFPTGGSVDVITSGFNGILADNFTSKALADAISTALNLSFDRKSIRADTLRRFNINDKADQYIELYKKQLCLKF